MLATLPRCRATRLVSDNGSISLQAHGSCSGFVVAGLGVVVSLVNVEVDSMGVVAAGRGVGLDFGPHRCVPLLSSHGFGLLPAWMTFDLSFWCDGVKWKRRLVVPERALFGALSGPHCSCDDLVNVAPKIYTPRLPHPDLLGLIRTT